MNLPQRQQTPNAYQIAGQAFGQAGQLVDQYGQQQQATADNKLKLQAMMLDMAQKREAAQMAKIKADREIQMETEKEQRAAAAAEYAKGEIVSPTLSANPNLSRSSRPLTPGGPTQAEADGLTLSGDQIPAQTIGASDPLSLMNAALDRIQGSSNPGRVPRTRDEIIQNQLENRQMTGSEYASATTPLKTIDWQRELNASKNEIQDKRDDARRQHDWAKAEFNQGRIDRRQLAGFKSRAVQAERAAELAPKGFGGLKKEGLGDTETKSIKDIRRTSSLLKRIDIAADNISNLKRGPMSGRVTGVNPYDADIAQLEKLVKQTVPSLARGVFGEVGVLTDEDVKRYQDMFATIKTDPSVARVLMDDLKKTIEDSWYITLDTYEKSNKNIAGFDPYWDFDKIAEIGDRQEKPRQTEKAQSAKKTSVRDFGSEYGF